MSTIEIQPTTVYADAAKAWEMTNRIQADDHEWTYRVQPFGQGFAIFVYDEENIKLGSL